MTAQDKKFYAKQTDAVKRVLDAHSFTVSEGFQQADGIAKLTGLPVDEVKFSLRQLSS